VSEFSSTGVAQAPSGPIPARAGVFEGTWLDPYLAAFAQLERHEIAAIALMLGILCFAVVTAIMLVRTRARLAESEAAARDESMAARAEIDRTIALLRSDPQILVSWPAAADEPEIIGDSSLVAGTDAPHRVLAFGTWLEAEQARTMERLVEQLRARGEGFAT